jgi:hypothetical protein
MCRRLLPGVEGVEGINQQTSLVTVGIAIASESPSRFEVDSRLARPLIWRKSNIPHHVANGGEVTTPFFQSKPQNKVKGYLLFHAVIDSANCVLRL